MLKAGIGLLPQQYRKQTFEKHTKPKHKFWFLVHFVDFFVVYFSN